MRKIKNVLIGLICLMMLMPTVVLASNTKPEEWGDVRIDKKVKVEKGKAGEKYEIELPIINTGTSQATNVFVTPIQDEDSAIYPFVVKKTDEYTGYADLAANGGEDSKKIKFRVKKDALSKKYALKFNIEYYNGESKKVSLTREIFVDIEGAKATPTPTPKLKPGTPTPGPRPTDEPDHDDFGGGGGGYDDGGGSSGGGGGSDDGEDEDKKVGTPRVIIEGFRTEPKVVNAGASFKLILQVRNTSKKTAVNNMEINLQAAGASDSIGDESAMSSASDTFLPDKGSNTLYVDSIAADSTKEVSIDLTARADLQQQPYSIGIAMKYEDNKATQYDAASEISIPVNQRARFELSQVEVSPETIEVNGEGNVIFSIYNLGRTKLYNVKVKLIADTIADGEAFVGNLDAGATGEVDLMVTGVSETTNDGTVKILLTYEDKDGNASDYEDTCTIFVSQAMDQGEMPFDGEMMMPEDEQEGLGTPAKIGIGAGAAAVVAAGTFGIIRHRRKKEEDFTDEFLGSDKDERK